MIDKALAVAEDTPEEVALERAMDAAVRREIERGEPIAAAAETVGEVFGLARTERAVWAEHMEIEAQWQGRDVSVVLPIAEARRLWQEARRREGIDPEVPSIDVESDHITLWSKQLPGEEPSSEPNGVFYVDWKPMSPGSAIIYRISWNPEEDGSEEMVWQAMESLAGRSLRS